MTLQVVDRWTTQDGSWDVDISHEYGIDLMHAVEYVSEANELGGATHIYVRPPAETQVMFYTMGANGPENVYTTPAKPNGWANLGMTKDSGYKPALGQGGPWYVDIAGVNVARGIGLPDGLHVSTFLVVEDRIDAPLPQPGKDKYQVLKNGAVVATWEE